MSITRIPHRLISYQFGLLTGIFCIVALFFVLQAVSSLMLSASVSDAQHSEGYNQLMPLQQAKIDEARVALLSVSDLLNRAGIYLIQGAVTGPDGSQCPLMEETHRALAQSKSVWDTWRDMKSQSNPDLTESYQRFHSGIQEQADGSMQSGSIDAFFAIPVQAFQIDSNGSHAHFQQDSGRHAEAEHQQLLASLERLQNLFLFIPLALVVVTFLIWHSVFRWVIMPLQRLIDYIDILMAGGPSRSTLQVSRFNREVTQSSLRIAAMQQGFCALVRQVNDTTTVVTGNINKLMQNNKQLYQQSAKQNEESSTVTSHISVLETHVKGNSGFTELANRRAVQTRDIAADGGRMMATVNAPMQATVTRSSEMRGIATLIDNIAFQINTLALNATIEAARAGE